MEIRFSGCAVRATAFSLLPDSVQFVLLLITSQASYVSLQARTNGNLPCRAPLVSSQPPGRTVAAVKLAERRNGPANVNRNTTLRYTVKKHSCLKNTRSPRDEEPNLPKTHSVLVQEEENTRKRAVIEKELHSARLFSLSCVFNPFMEAFST